MTKTLESAISAFGANAKKRLGNLAASGEPEEQLRTPLDTLLLDLVEVLGLPRDSVTLVGESRIADLLTRPDFAVTRANGLAGFIEVKAPGKGADPRRFKNKHDKAQWAKLQALPNLLYTDGNAFSLWTEGELVDIVRLEGDIETSGTSLKAPPKLLKLVSDFVLWDPEPPRNARELARQTARLCQFLRNEVLEQLALGSAALSSLATGWRKMLFPEASDAQFADGYAQAVTFGLLVARARNIKLADGLDRVARTLGGTDSLIGAALDVVTREVESEKLLTTSLTTLVRVLDVVNWSRISENDPDAWLYFYEDFLEVYDNRLRKQTGSYYTPPEVVAAMTRLVDEALRSPKRFARPRGLADREVTIADPASGTGTFVLGLLRRIAETIAEAEGAGAVAGAMNAALQRVIAFEMQLGPFAVAQLRILGEVAEFAGEPPNVPLRMYVTDTLGNPFAEIEWVPGSYERIAQSRRTANEIKRRESITVVVGNPPYKEKAKGLGGWVETDQLARWIPPADWGVGAHAKHLRNLYVYFWRWATWKVFDHESAPEKGIVCFITVAGFLNGPGFQRMREYLRRTANEIWVIDCSPEGHQPDVPTRIFQGVQQPVCIVLASRVRRDDESPAVVRFRQLPEGDRELKFAALAEIALDDDDWIEGPAEWRAPFLAVTAGAWATYPALDDFFVYNGSGVMPGRTWVIAPDRQSLQKRWNALINAPANEMEELFQPHIQGDKTPDKGVRAGLHGHELRTNPVRDDHGSCIGAARYSFRSFDRQWIIPDARLINRPNPTLWNWFTPHQIHLTAPSDRSPANGPGISFSAAIPDLHHYHGRGGRVFPLWQEHETREPNQRPALLAFLGEQYCAAVGAEDLMAYIAAVAAHPAYTSRFQADLVQPGLRIPLTADADTFRAAVELGRRVVWLHTYGERFADADAGRPAGPPRLPRDRAPRVPADGAIPDSPDEMPNEMTYELGPRRLHVGKGRVENVTPEMWGYEVSGKNVVRQWFSYRRRDRSRPVMGDRRPPSKLTEIQPDRWLAEYTTDLIDLLNVLGLLVDLEPEQEKLLHAVCEGPLHTRAALDDAGALALPPQRKRSRRRDPSLFDDERR